MNEMIIKLIHQKLDKELEKIPHKFGEQSIKIKMIVEVLWDQDIEVIEVSTKEVN